MNSEKRWYPLPAAVRALVEQVSATVLLECGRPGPATSDSLSPIGRSKEHPSRLFIAPLRVIEVNEAAELQVLFKEIESAVAEDHFAAGFFSYECGQCFEPKAGMLPRKAGEPLAWFGIYDRCYHFDHRAGAFADGAPP